MQPEPADREHAAQQTLQLIGQMLMLMEDMEDGDESHKFRSKVWPNSACLYLAPEAPGVTEDHAKDVRQCVQEV